MKKVFLYIFLLLTPIASAQITTDTLADAVDSTARLGRSTEVLEGEILMLDDLIEPMEEEETSTVTINYQLTDKPGTRKYRLKITYNPHEVNTVYTDVLTLNIFDTKRNVIVATTSINLKGDAVASIKGNGGATAVENAEVVENAKKDGKYFKDGKLIIVKGNQEFDANGAQQK